MQLHLRVANGAQEGKLIAVKHAKFLIGRSDDCHLRPKSESISRRHCAIVHKEGKVLLIDLKSRNGTEVNGKKLDPARAKILKDGDHIKIGKLEFVAVMEAGVKSVKKSEVKDVKEAAARAAEKVSDSRFEEVDVSSWLDEPEQIERAGTETISRNFEFPEGTEIDTQDTVMDSEEAHETQAEGDPRKKKKPGKLPKLPTKPSSGSSKDAASETLRKFFSGGR
ncbi:MAG: FHA domain-containing protein [bacterium]|nr:FHA domain-containing protein [bacterium]